MPHPSGRPWIVAHRGARLLRAENTVDAFRAAHALGADAVELDVRRTADGALIVVHDASLPGWRRPFVEMTRAEVRSVAPHIPDLEDAIDACDDMWIDIEIKNAPFEPDWDQDATTTRKVAALVRSRGAEDRAVITSFDPGSVTVALGARMRAGLLVIRSADPVEALGAIPGIEMILPHVSALSGRRAIEIVTTAAARRVEVGVWTVNDAAEMRRLAEAGVGAIATDDPALAASAIGGDSAPRHRGPWLDL